MPLAEVIASLDAGPDLDDRGERVAVSQSVIDDPGLVASQPGVAGSRVQVRVVRQSAALGSHADVVCTVAEVLTGSGHRIRLRPAAGKRVAQAGEKVRVTAAVTYVDLQGSHHLWQGARVVVLAPHGGQIEEPTDLQTAAVVGDTRFAASDWTCVGQGGNEDERLHITGGDLSEHSFPGLAALLAVPHDYALSFHGYTSVSEGWSVIVCGRAEQTVKDAFAGRIRSALAPYAVPADAVHVATSIGGKYAGMAASNVVIRLGSSGVQTSSRRRSGTSRAPPTPPPPWRTSSQRGLGSGAHGS